MVEFNLTHFDEFIYGCKSLLDSTVIDLQKWEPFYKPEAAYKAHLLQCKTMKVNRKEAEKQAREIQQRCELMNAESKAHWEKTSFYSNGEMKTANGIWNEHEGNIRSNANISRSHLINLILCDRNGGVKKLTEKKLTETFNRLKEFNQTYKMNDNTNLTVAKNLWFWDLYDLVDGYYKWFEETFFEQHKMTKSTTLNDIFIENDYEKHMEPLCTMTKPLLRRNNDKSYTLLRGKGAICRYFYQDLKDTALKNKITQEDISTALYKSIKDFGKKPNRNSYNETFLYRDLQKHITHKN